MKKKRCIPNEDDSRTHSGRGGKMRGKAFKKWRELRVAGLCVGVDQYPYIDNLHNAVKDAEDVSRELKALPRCYSEVVDNPKTAAELLRRVRARLEEPELLENPPEIFLFHFAGHGVEHDKTTYLVPGDAKLKHKDDLELECLSLVKLLKAFRDILDAPVRSKHGEKRAISFVVVLDSCRSVCQSFAKQGGRNPNIEPSAQEVGSLKYAIIYSCARTKEASDGENETNSPFAKALLDRECGIFAEGVKLEDALRSASNAVKKYQQVIRAGVVDAIPRDFCINDIITNSHPSSFDAPPGSGGHGGLGDASAGKRKRMDEDLKALLLKFKLGDEEELLAEGGVRSLEDLKELEELDIVKLRLGAPQAKRFRRLLAQEKRARDGEPCSTWSFTTSLRNAT